MRELVGLEPQSAARAEHALDSRMIEGERPGVDARGEDARRRLDGVVQRPLDVDLLQLEALPDAVRLVLVGVAFRPDPPERVPFQSERGGAMEPEPEPGGDAAKEEAVTRADVVGGEHPSRDPPQRREARRRVAELPEERAHVARIQQREDGSGDAVAQIAAELSVVESVVAVAERQDHRERRAGLVSGEHDPFPAQRELQPLASGEPEASSFGRKHAGKREGTRKPRERRGEGRGHGAAADRVEGRARQRLAHRRIRGSARSR